ncbi:MAG: hypothetical protein ACP5NS_02140 [Candidatus Pacearchaeota archaeon]
MKKRVIVPLIAVCVFILAIVIFADSSVVLLQTPSNPPLTPAEINEVREYIVELNNKWPKYRHDIIEELDDDGDPNPDAKKALEKKLDDWKSLVGGCWALPNSNRPIDSSSLKKALSRLEEAADRDGENSNVYNSPNIGDYSLNAEIDRLNEEAKSLIAAWCNKGQPANAREFCPCSFNCAGTDNTGKTWSATSYTCNDNCIAPATCQTSTCTCVTPAPTPESKPSKNPESQPSDSTAAIEFVS